MAKRKLAYIQTILDLKPIPNADRIELATIRAWSVVVKKGEFKVGDKCVYFEIDSILPDKPWSEFLGTNKRLKTLKLRGQISQGMALPIKTVGIENTREIDTDLTEELNVQKYVAKIPAHLDGKVKNMLPSFLQKTDEERVQNLKEHIETKLQETEFYITEKCDGTSSTFYDYEGNFGVCGRNMEFYEDDKNTFWQLANKLKLKEMLKGKNIAIQGEVVGPGIQANRLQLEERKLLIFNVFDIQKHKRYDFVEFIEFCRINKLETVPILENNFSLNHTAEELVKMAEGKSVFGNMQREGLVFRALKDNHCSFKTISNKYLLKG